MPDGRLSPENLKSGGGHGNRVDGVPDRICGTTCFAAGADVFAANALGVDSAFAVAAGLTPVAAAMLRRRVRPAAEAG